MRIPILLFAVLASGISYAQKAGIYAVTDTKAGGAAWLNIREANVDAGEGKLILKNQDFEGSRIEVLTQQKSAVSSKAINNNAELPLSGGVAALAYDRLNNRLYYSTMFTGDIRYITPGKNENNYYQVGRVYDAITLPNNLPLSANNQGPVITRLTMGADGYLYGLSNNGDAFFRLSTRAKKPVVEELGKLVDAGSNGAMSVHSSCSSWGGDMVASADGDIYLFSMYQQVFKVNPTTKVATHLGKIEGLPGDFTVNGAAVDENGAIVLSSATLAGKVAIIADLNNLKAEVKENAGWYNASDLASGNLLFDKKDAVVFGEFERSTQVSGVGVFPNPVSNGQVVVHFKEGMKGRHSLDLLDIAGGVKAHTVVNVNGDAQRFTLGTGNLAQGLYLLRVVNQQQREIETIKVMIR
jgi:hypothetical protein